MFSADEDRYQSWGRYPRVHHRGVLPVQWRETPPDLASIKTSVLPYGRGLSYGDSCLNEDGVLLDAAPLDRFIHFDEKRGLLRCEAGVTFEQILDLIVPRGWFLPVTPGTKYLTVGGAIANDVHGKNHHQDGTFGRHVTAFEMLRSDGTRHICTPTENAGLYRATIGGLGLTGLILWAEFDLKPILSPLIDVERIRFRSLDEFFEISAESDETHQYHVSWVDCLARGANLGRGLLMRGNHYDPPLGVNGSAKPKLKFTVPVEVPGSGYLLNKYTVNAFNNVIYRAQLGKTARWITHYDPFFYPLDAVREWNKLYGKDGFLQYQCVVPYGQDAAAMKDILRRIAQSGEGSFLAVLKTFGDVESPGRLSFPRPGVTLALDFPFKGASTLRLLEDLDTIVRESGGAVYPAKDARMSAANFQAYYPQWRDFAQHIDPKFSSSFWRRVTHPVGAPAAASEKETSYA